MFGLLNDLDMAGIEKAHGNPATSDLELNIDRDVAKAQRIKTAWEIVGWLKRESDNYDHSYYGSSCRKAYEKLEEILQQEGIEKKI